MNELITIVVPVYNIAPLLSRSIGSLLNQTYKNIEVVAVDDGSKDSSLQILKRVAESDSRLRVIHQENMGVTKARLTGIRAAKGDLIGFMDGDDEVEPDMYERLIRNANAYNAQISHCGYQMIFSNHIKYYYNTGRIILQDNETGLKDLIEGLFVEPSLGNKLFHRSLFINLAQEMNLDVKENEDLLMNYYLFKRAERSVYEDFCPYHYIIRKGSSSQDYTNLHRWIDPAIVMKTIKEDCQYESCKTGIIGRYAGRLIALTEHKPTRRQAVKELQKILPDIKQCGRKVWLQSNWVALSPYSYTMVHKIYRKFKVAFSTIEKIPKLFDS